MLCKQWYYWQNHLETSSNLCTIIGKYMYKTIEKSFWTVFVHRICVLIIALVMIAVWPLTYMLAVVAIVLEATGSETTGKM